MGRMIGPVPAADAAGGVQHGRRRPVHRHPVALRSGWGGVRAGAFAAALLAGAGLLWPGVAEEARHAAADLLGSVVPRPARDASPVLAVGVTEADLAAYGPWPWPRDRLARLIERLAEADAAAVALDIALPEPAPGDAELRAALAAAPAVLGMLAGQGALPAGFGIALFGAPGLSDLLAIPGAEAPAPAGAPVVLSVLPGRTVRGVPMLARVGPAETRGGGTGDTAAGLVPGLAVGALARAIGTETLLVRAGPPRLLQLGDAALPLPPGGMLRLHPARRGVPLLPAAAVLEGDPALRVRGRIVVVGVTAAEAASLRPSVLGPFTPSLMVQAEAVAQLAAGWVPLRPPGGARAEALATLLLGLLAAVAVRRWPGRGLGLALLLAVLWVAGVAAALRFGPVLVDAALPVAGVLLAAAAEAAANARRLARERERLLSRFVHRLPTGVAERLLARPEAERLRPERCRVAVVMTDLAGFSAMVRGADPAAVVALLNAYLAGLEAVVIGAGGTLERLIGDSVLAVFGAPLPQPDHAARALAAARAIDRFAEAFRRRPEARALGWGETRIGVAAGEVLAGEIGGSRLTWVVCGDAANTAARLQDLAKSLGRRALVAGLEDVSLAPALGSFALRGLPGTVAVHPLGESGPRTGANARDGGSAPQPAAYGGAAFGDGRTPP